MRDNLHPSNITDGVVQGSPERAAPVREFTLRILATSDVHGQLFGFDYIRDRSTGTNGLAGLARHISKARSEAREAGMAVLLVDNGDLLQGSALAKRLARWDVDSTHPVVAALNYLEYDVWGIGNHDLDFGIDYLTDIAAHLRFPVICSNLDLAGNGPIRRSATISYDARKAADGTGADLKVAILSALPEATAEWNFEELRDRAQVTSSVSAITAEADALRHAGADIVILLAHMGLEGPAEGTDRRDDLRSLAAIPGIDAIISGHTHRRLPGPDHDGFAEVDAWRGCVCGRPTVMPGFNASDLAVLDLRLSAANNEGWQVTQHAASLRSNRPDTIPNPAVIRQASAAHERLRVELAEPCCHHDRPIHNFFSLVAPTQTAALVASARRHAIADALTVPSDLDLPLLATASAHTAGGHGGASNFIFIPAGTIRKRHIEALTPFDNPIWALRLRGRDIRHWLEQSACAFNRLLPDRPDQPILQHSRPSFEFDTIFGIDYGIDPCRPEGERITGLAYQGKPLEDDQPVILATSQFRVAAGRGKLMFSEDQVAARAQTTLSTALTITLGGGRPAHHLGEKPWHFAPSPPVQAVFETTRESHPYLREIAHLQPRTLPTETSDFARFRLTF